MIKSINSVNFNGKNYFNQFNTQNSLKKKTEKYYIELFEELEKGYLSHRNKTEFYNPRTQKMTTFYPSTDSRLVTVRPLGGNDELRLTKIDSTGGMIKEKGILDKSSYSTSHKDYSCELWIPGRGFVNINKI